MNNRQQNATNGANLPPKKNKFWTWFFVTFNLVAIVLIVLMERTHGTDVDIWEAIWYVGQNPSWFLLTLGAYFLMLYAESFAYTNLIYSTTGRVRFGLSTRISVLGKYYDNLTPLATGGQPFQIHTLTKKGVPIGKSTGVVMIKYFVNQIVFDLTVIVFMIFSPYRPSGIIQGMAYVGLLILIALPLFLAFVGYSKKSGIKILSAVLRFCNKIKIVKNLDKTLQNMLNQVDEFRRCMSYLTKKKNILFFQLAMSVFEVFAKLSIPYFVYRAFGMTADNYFQITTLYVYCLLAVSFVPTPGTSGAAEFSFYTVFGALITNGTMFWALLLWRFASFYVFIIAGVILHANDFINKFLFPSREGNDDYIDQWEDRRNVPLMHGEISTEREDNRVE